MLTAAAVARFPLRSAFSALRAAPAAALFARFALFLARFVTPTAAVGAAAAGASAASLAAVFSCLALGLRAFFTRPAFGFLTAVFPFPALGTAPAAFWGRLAFRGHLDAPGARTQPEQAAAALFHDLNVPHVRHLNAEFVQGFLYRFFPFFGACFNFSHCNSPPVRPHSGRLAP